MNVKDHVQAGMVGESMINGHELQELGNTLQITKEAWHE